MADYIKSLGPVTGYGSSAWAGGLDVGVKRGTPLKAPVSGTIIAAANKKGWGNQVVIRKDDGETIALSHNDTLDVKPGDRVIKNQPLGRTGNTGTVLGSRGEALTKEQVAAGRGAHVDITYRDAKGKVVDPRQVQSKLNTKDVILDKTLPSRIDKARSKGYTDTDILNYLSNEDYDLAKNINIARNSYSQNQQGVTNDRDLINWLSTKYSGSMPKVPSVRTGEQQREYQAQRVENQKKKEGEQAIAGTLMRDVNPLTVATGKYMKSAEGIEANRASIAKSRAEDEALKKRAEQSYLKYKAPWMPSKTYNDVTGKYEVPNTETMKETLKEADEEGTALTAARYITQYALPEGQMTPGLMSRMTAAEERGVAAMNKPIKEAASSVAESISNVGRKVAQPIEKLGQKVAKPVEKLGAAVARPAENLLGTSEYATRQASKADELTARIIQDRSGLASKKLKNLDTAQEVLSRTDMTAVKTFEEGKAAVQDSTNKLMRAKENFLAQDDRTFTKAAFNKEFDGEVVNHVQDGINDLRKAYRARFDEDGIAFTAELQSKLDNGKITALDVEKLAQKYGSEYSRRSFSSASGDPLMSYTGTRFEGTRSGIKSTVRDLFPESKLLSTTDRMISNNIAVQKMFDKVSSKVMTLESNAAKEGLWSKYFGGAIKNAVKVADMATGHASRKILREIGLNIFKGEEKMNAARIQQKLNKYLRELDNINNSKGAKFDEQLFNFLDREISKSKSARISEQAYQKQKELANSTKKALQQAQSKVKLLKGPGQNPIPVSAPGAKNSLYGAVAGFETEQGEDGKIRVKFNAKKAAAGILIMGGVAKVGDSELVHMTSAKAKQLIEKNGFSLKKFGKGLETSDLEPIGIYFHPSKASAKRYIRNVVDLDFDEEIPEHIAAQVLAENTLKKPFILETVKQWRDLVKESAAIEGKTQGEKVTNYLIKQGYDGLNDVKGSISKEINDLKEPAVIIFDPSNIKIKGAPIQEAPKNYKIHNDGYVEFFSSEMEKFAERVDNLKYIQIANKENLDDALRLFNSAKGRQYNEAMLDSLKKSYPKNFNEDGTITLYRGGDIREGVNSFTVNMEDAKGYSNWSYGSKEGQATSELHTIKVKPEDVEAIINGEEFLINKNNIKNEYSKYALGLDEERNYKEALKNYRDGFYPNPEADFYDRPGHFEYGSPLPDKTYKWLDSYTRGTVRHAPSSSIQDDLNWFIPKEPVVLYRGIPKSGDYVSNVGFRSWTYDKRVAESFAGEDGEVIMQLIEPKDILFDSTKSPMAIWADLMNPDEMEVIVKNKSLKPKALPSADNDIIKANKPQGKINSEGLAVGSAALSLGGAAATNVKVREKAASYDKELEAIKQKNSPIKPFNAPKPVNAKALIKPATPKTPQQTPSSLKKGTATVYNPKKAQTDADPHTGSFGTKMEFGDVAVGNRKEHALAKHKFNKDGKDTYVYIPEYKDIKTPHGNGIFRVRDTMNKRYDGQNRIDVFIPEGGSAVDKKVRSIPNISYSYTK